MNHCENMRNHSSKKEKFSHDYDQEAKNVLKNLHKRCSAVT